MKTANSTETLERVMRLVPIKTTRSKKKQQKSTPDLHRKKSKSGKSKSTIQKGVRKTQQRFKSASSVEEVVKVQVIRNSDLKNLSPTPKFEQTTGNICIFERKLEA